MEYYSLSLLFSLFTKYLLTYNSLFFQIYCDPELTNFIFKFYVFFTYILYNLFLYSLFFNDE